MNQYTKNDSHVYLTDMGKKLVAALAKKNGNDPILYFSKNPVSKPKAEKQLDRHGRLTGLKSNNIPIPHAADPLRNPDDIKRIQQYFLRKGSIRDYTLFTLGICFGLRIGDLLSLHFYDIMESQTSFKKYVEIYEDKTNKLNRIYISPLVVDTIKMYTEYLNQTTGYRITDYIFKSPKTRWDEYGEEGQSPITPQAVHTILKKAAKEVGIQGNISTHTLRKTFSYWSLKLNEGDSTTLYTLQNALNHSDTRNTLRYAGISQDNVDTMRSDVASFFQGNKSTQHVQQKPYTSQYAHSSSKGVNLPYEKENAVQGATGTSAPLVKKYNTDDSCNSQKEYDYSLEHSDVPSYILENPYEHLDEIQEMLENDSLSDEDADLIYSRMKELK